MRLHFVSAPGGSAFMHELLTVVALEVEATMDRSRIESVEVSEGPLLGEPDDVFVVVPHEYFRVLSAPLLPDDSVLKRTIGFCVEHPGTDTFTTTLGEARRLGACVDINDDSTLQLSASGVPVERFQLGYSSHWDVWGGVERERPVDVLYLGTTDDRRSRYLSIDPEVLGEYEVFMAMPPHEPMTRPRPDFLMGAEKLRMLSQSKLLLNLHRAESVSFEWVRALEAMSNGCVIVSEHSSDHSPLVPGRHFISGSPYNLGHLARAMLTDQTRLRAMREDTYQFLRNELPMRSSALMLAELACEVATAPRPTSAPRRAHAHTSQWPRSANGTTNLSPIHVHETGPGDTDSRPSTSAQTPQRETRSPGSIDALVLASDTMQLTSADSADLLRNLQLVGDESARVFVHPSPRAEPGQEPSALSLLESNSEFLLLLESRDRLLPGALSRLRTALEQSEADASYGFVISPGFTFLSALPFERERLLTRPYLATASMWRRTVLLRLGDWDNGCDSVTELSQELWRKLAIAGGHARLVPRPLVRQLTVLTVERT